MAHVMEDCLKRLDKPFSFQTRREGHKAIIVLRGQNANGRFLKLIIEYGSGSRNNFIVIPDGQNGSGWVLFARKLRELVG